jgi:oligoribonuclease
LVTDVELTVLGEGVQVVVRPPEEALRQMGDFVREMHVASGLLDQLAEGLTLEQASEQVLAYVREWVPEANKAPLAGNTVSTDRIFLARDMPELEQHLHYRIVDVSSIKELARRWYPRAYYNAPTKTGGHRALGDIQDSIAELRYYRRAVFRDPPGLDTSSLRTLASR